MHGLLVALLAWGAVAECHGRVGSSSSLFHRPADTSNTDHAPSEDYTVEVDTSRTRRSVDTSNTDHAPSEDYTVEVDTSRTRRSVDTSNTDHAPSEDYTVEVETSRTRRSVDTSDTDHAPSEDYTVEVNTSRTRRSVDTSRTGGVDWNYVVDTIFTATKQDITDLGKDVIPLSEVSRNFKREFGFVKVNGRFLANQGTLRNLTSFRRSGDVSAVREDAHYKMVCTLTLDDLRVRYEHYELDVFGFGPRGHLEGTVTSNTIRMTLIFAKVAEGCLSTLQEVKLTELGGLKVNVSGLGDFDSLGSAIATWIVEQRRTEIVESVERVLAREIEDALKDFQCDEYASLLAL